ncbi:LysR family transcriptional regulator [Streptomyces sp. KLOTTS4A1]|uniref:LysR family transcriptional regulator n=1 Tax=Streptomyces sp. KLOTTS4A1 TaxID=3390996 RepID=UPI0039F5DA95
MIDVQRLRILRAVAAHGSFNRAATELRLTPSAVSQHIAVLERSLGTEVVSRSTRGVTLTPAGRIMVDAAESVAAELAHAREQVDRLETGRPQLTIATFNTGGRVLLPAALARLAEKHPGTVVHVQGAEPETSLPLVRQGAVDLALAYHFDGPLPHSTSPRSRLAWSPLLDDPLHVVLPHGHPLCGREKLDLTELAAEPWVLGCLKTADFLHRHAERAGFEPDVRSTTTDYFFATSLVAAGLGISLIPTMALTPRNPDIHTIPITPPAPTRHLGIATLRNRHHPQAETLAEALHEAATTWPPPTPR